jgi:serine protease Do
MAQTHYKKGGRKMNDAKKIRSKSMAKAKVMGVLIALSILVAGVLYWYKGGANNAPLTERNVPQTDGNLQTTTNEDVITSIAESVSPSVVSIVTNVTTQTIFGATKGEAAGTGIIVSKDGYVLTNKHVVSGANKVEVILSDGTTTVHHILMSQEFMILNALIISKHPIKLILLDMH